MKKNLSGIIIGICVVLLLLGGGFGVYKYTQSRNEEKQNENITPEPDNSDEPQDNDLKPPFFDEKMPEESGDMPQYAKPDIPAGEENIAYVSESISYLAAEQNPTPTPLPDGISSEIALKLEFDDDGTWEFSKDNCYYSRDVELTVKAPAGSVVRYTLDGSLPDTDSTEYTAPIVLKAIDGDFPDCCTFRAVCFDENGNASAAAARSFLISPEIAGRFSTPVFFVSGDPDELVNEPDGIFCAENCELRGRDYERMVYVEAFDAKGKNLLSQYAGVRIYGGASRTSSIKSMKLFSRKSYDEDHKNFKFDLFGTPKLDGSEDTIGKYDKLVLRNCGNDFQFGFIRDELNQRLCRKAGMEVYEAVVPAVCYLNGSYYGMFWLHENYCDKYFKEKFGDGQGEFVVAEGSEQHKSDDDDGLVQQYVDEYNAAYGEFTAADLKDPAEYAKLCDFMDVENYLDFYAWNIAVGNFDWPNNNFKCYRYVPAEGESLGTGVFDGRWRFLPHDMDYCYGLYDSIETKANYDTLKIVLNKNHNRYAPLFAALMEIKDCRDYFRKKTTEYIEGALSPESIAEEYASLHAERSSELDFYYRHLRQVRGRGDWSIWCDAGNYKGHEETILESAAKRAGYVKEYMDKLLPEL